MVIIGVMKLLKCCVRSSKCVVTKEIKREKSEQAQPATCREKEADPHTEYVFTTPAAAGSRTRPAGEGAVYKTAVSPAAPASSSPGEAQALVVSGLEGAGAAILGRAGAAEELRDWDRWLQWQGRWRVVRLCEKILGGR